MANMAHCRFRNTLRDLRDCFNNMERDEPLDAEEQRAKEQLLVLCEEFVKSYG